MDWLKKLSQDVEEIKLTLAAQHVSLEQHMRRTELLEKEIRPISQHVAVFNAIIKAALPVAGIVLSVLKYLGKL